MKLNKRRHSRITGLKRDIFSYRYIKRNVLVVLAVAVSATGIGTVVKYGEALDHSQAYAENVVEEVVEVEVTEETTEETATEVEAAETGNASIEAQDNDIVADAEEESEFDDKFVAVVSDTLNVRAEADSEADIVGKLFDGNIGDVIEETDEWTKISSGNVTGYVSSEYILTGEEAEEYAADFVKVVGTITDESVRVRSEASTESEILDVLSEGTTLTVAEDDAEWVQVSMNDGSAGYVSADYISVEESYEYAMTIDEYNAMIEAENEAAAEAAKAEEATEAESIETATASGSESSQSSSTTSSSSSSSASTSSSSSSQTTESNSSSGDTTSSSSDASQYSDSYLLACLVSMEAGSEPYEGQLAVANVVLNRVKSGKWGSSIYSVIYAANQFPSVTGSVMQKYLKNGPLDSAQKAADEALAGNNNIGSYMSFLNVKYVDTSSLSSYKVIGNHCFY